MSNTQGVYNEMSERPTLQLRRFPIEQMPDNSACVIVAESEGGKTTLGVDIMWHKRHLPAWFLFSTSEGCSQRLSQIVAPCYTYSKFNLEALAKIYKHQEQKIQKYTRPRTEEERRRIPDDELPLEERFFKNPCVGGFYEDCFANKKIFSKDIVRDLFKNGRHRMMFSILPCQYVMDLPPECRNQVKYWFLLREDSPETRKKLFNHIGGACKTLDIFNEIMNQCTNDYGCVVIDNINKSKHIEDRVFHYRAKLRPAFRVGSSRYWQFHDKNYVINSNKYNEEEEEARRRLGRARQRVPPTHNPFMLCTTPYGQDQYQGTYNDNQNQNQNELNSPSMVSMYNRGQQRIEDILTGNKRTPKFNVAMMPATNTTTASSA